jgi:hypothetical protein
MKYLCLLYDNEESFAALADAEMNAVMSEYFAFTNATIASGKFIAGEELAPTHTATTVRVRKGITTTTDGPFAETKEQLGGFYLIDAIDLNDAVQIASRIPAARTGSVEVRPVMVHGDS